MTGCDPYMVDGTRKRMALEVDTPPGVAGKGAATGTRTGIMDPAREGQARQEGEIWGGGG